MRAMPMLRITFRVRNANIIVSNGGTMQYHGITLVSAGCCDCAKAASTQMAVKMTAETIILSIIFVFTIIFSLLSVGDLLSTIMSCLLLQNQASKVQFSLTV